MKGKILIFGSTGGIGKNFCEFLKNKNIKFYKSSRKRFHRCDLSSKIQVNKILKKLKPSIILNFTGSYSNNFQIDFKNNFIHTKNIFDATIQTNQKNIKIIILGSAAEYGKLINEKNGVKETQICKPDNNYGFTKYMQTKLSKFYVENYGLNIVVARVFNVLSNNAKSKLFFSDLNYKLNQLKKNKKKNIKLIKDLSLRDFINHNHLNKSLYKIIRKGLKNNIYNIGVGKKISSYDIVKKYIKLNKIKASRINFILKTNKIKSFYADITKLKNL